MILITQIEIYPVNRLALIVEPFKLLLSENRQWAVYLIPFPPVCVQYIYN